MNRRRPSGPSPLMPCSSQNPREICQQRPIAPFCVCQVAQIAYGLLPRDVFISVEQRTPGNLDPDEWAILRRVIDLIQENAKGAELGPVLETIENALRADQAKMIEANESGAAGGGDLRRPRAGRLVIGPVAADPIQRGADGVVAMNAE